MEKAAKKSSVKETFQGMKTVSCLKLKEYLKRRNMHFEEKKTGMTTTIIIRGQPS